RVDGRKNPLLRSALVDGGRLTRDGGELVGPCDTQECLSLKNAGCRTAQIVVLLERSLDQLLELIVLKDVEPLVVSKRMRIILRGFFGSQSTIDTWSTDDRFLVVWSNRAATED